MNGPRPSPLAMGAVDAPSGGIPEIGIGMLGHGFMGRAHSHGYRTLSYMMYPAPLQPILRTIAGRDRIAVAAAAVRFGYERSATDWRTVVEDPSVGLFDNAGPNNVHVEPTLAAARAGQHVMCEKPLGRTADEALSLWREVAATGVTHMCGFNYRFVPAVRLARTMIAAGDIGEIRHFRGRYLQEWTTDPGLQKVWRLSRENAGSGALGDLGAHVFDLARYLVGEITAVSGVTRTFVANRPGGVVDVDDAFEATIEFDSDAIGTIEASRVCPGHKNDLSWEINGSRGSIAFDLERLNELSVYLPGDPQERLAQGFRRVLVSEADHPFWRHWWPAGHVIGWEHTFAHELHHLLGAIAVHGPVTPDGADFEDGYRAAELCDAVLRSAVEGRRVPVSYRGLNA